MTDRVPSRIEQARLRAAAAKRVLAWGSAAAFAAVLVLARVGHPGHAATAPATPATADASVSALFDDEEGGGLSFGDGSIAPGGAAPQIQSHAS